MPDFELSGPDGAHYQLTAPDEAAALAAFSSLHGSKEAKEPISTTNLARSASHGVPIFGGLADTMEAGLETALSYPVEPAMRALGMERPGQMLSDEGTSPVSRFIKARQLQQQKTAGFEAEHPVVDTAAKIAGGVGSLGGVMARVPGAATALGATGTMPQMIARGATSGAALSAADALARGESPVQAAEEGAVLGAAGGPVGKAIGKVAGATIGAFRPKAPPVPARTANVAGVDVPLPNRDPTAASEIEIARKGAAGVPAQEVVKAGDEARDAALEQARRNIGGLTDPTNPAAVAPQEAADVVGAELQAAERLRFQTEQNARQRAIAGTEELRRSLDTSHIAPQNVPRETPSISPAPTSLNIYAENPMSAAEILSRGVQGAAETAAAARTAAYEAKAAIPGEYSRAALARSGQAIRSDLSQGGADAVRISEGLTPRAAEAIRVIDETIGGQPPRGLPNEAAPFPIDPRTGIPSSVRPLEPITGTTMEDVRKQLNILYRDAFRAAQGPGGNATDERAMGRLIDAFDTHIGNVEAAGGFSGDAMALAQARTAARQAHAGYKNTFGPRNPKDEAGKAVEKIVGRLEGQQAGPDQILKLAYGDMAEPGGTPAAQVAQRLKEIFGENSKEWAANKQGLISYLIDNPDGTPRAAAEAAARIDKFLNAPKGKILAHVALTGKDRAALRAHAEVLRASEPVALKDLGSVDKIIARITGRDGMAPAMTNDLVNMFFGPMAGKATNNFQVMARLKRDLSPEGFTNLQKGMWSHLTETQAGKTDITVSRLWSNLDTFFNGSGKDVSKVLYPSGSPFRTEALKFIDALKEHMPVPGTTNPSGTAPMAAKVARKAARAVLPIMGLMHGGIGGAVVGEAANRVAGRLIDAKAAREIKSMYYGPQPRTTVPVDPRFAKAGVLLGRGVQQGQAK